MEIRNYKQANEFLLKGKNKDCRLTSKRSTQIIRLSDTVIGVRYHDTIVVEHHKDGHTVFNTGGWQTISTKARMNEFSSIDIQVWQKKSVWYITSGDIYSSASQGKTKPFRDGIVVGPRGSIKKAMTSRETKNKIKLTKQIKEYAGNYAQNFVNGEIKKPSGEDCFYCHCFSSLKKTEHFISHMEESYYVPSILKNAHHTRSSLIPPIVQDFIHNKWYRTDITVKDTEFLRDIAQIRIKQLIVWYLKTQLSVA